MDITEYVYKTADKLGVRYPAPETLKAARLLYPEERPADRVRQEDKKDIRRIGAIIAFGLSALVGVIIKDGFGKSPAMVAFLTVLLIIGVPALRLQKRKTDLENRRQELELAFSELTSKLSVLLGAGLSVKNAWEKIVADYRRDRERGIKERHILYEEMSLTLRLMNQGLSEKEAFKRFGERTGIPPYLRLCSLLESSMRSGSFELGKALELEARQSFELRLSAARRRGEKLGSKMLFPMMLLFVLVLLILLVPAFMGW